MSPRLREGIDAAKRGDKTTARRLLQQVLSTDGNNELALMWMASVVEAFEERRFYLERALRVNPNNTRAREALRRLGVTEPETAAAPSTRGAQAARAARALNTPNTNLYLIAAAVVAIVVIAVIVVSAISSLQPTPTPTSGVSAAQNFQATATARVAVTRTAERVPPTETLLPGIVVTLDAALVATLPPTFTPTFTPPPTETPRPTATPLPLSRFNIIYSDVEEGQEQGRASLYRASADGTGEIKLASGADGGFNDVDYDPVNERIVFVRRSAAEEPAYELFVAPLDAPEDAEQITQLGTRLLEKPRWTPDGTHIIFTSSHDDDEEIWQIAADGTDLVQLTDNEGIRDFEADISSDGSLIIFASERDSPGFSQIFSMKDTGEEVVRITTVPISSDPAWSPDGTRIAYVNNQQGDDDIYVMDADGQRSFLLTVDDAGAVDSSPVWSPDGRWIFFASNRDGGDTRWFAVDLQGNVQAITVAGRTPQTLSFITG